MDHLWINNIAAVGVAISGAVIVFVIGFAAGRFHTRRAFRHEFQDVRESETLGAMLNAQDKAKYALAYNDPTSAALKMDEIAYSVPNVLTPFVVTGPKPGLSGNAHVNSMQFRSPRELSVPKPAGVCRIFLTGGSTAFGSGAPSEDATPGAFLESLLNGPERSPHRQYCEVFTLANPAWASTHERIVIENRLSELQPDLVISLSGNNDAHWAAAGRDVFWFRTYADQHCWNLLNLARRLGGVEPMPEVEEHAATISPASVADRLAKNVLLSAAAVEMAGARYVFALQPMIAVSTKKLSARENEIRAAQAAGFDHFAQCYRYMRSRLSELSDDRLVYLDLSDIFADLGASDEIFLDSYHFGDRGNELVAARIADGIGPILDTIV